MTSHGPRDVIRKGRAKDVHTPASVADAAPLPCSRGPKYRPLQSWAHVAERRRFQEKGRKETLLIGRSITDVMLANRINLLGQARSPNVPRFFRQPSSSATHKSDSQQSQGQDQADISARLEAIPVLTTTVWKMEGLGSRVMRSLEAWCMRQALRYHQKRGFNPLQQQSPERASSLAIEHRREASKNSTPPITPATPSSGLSRQSIPTLLWLLGDNLSQLVSRLLQPVTNYVSLRTTAIKHAIERFLLEAQRQHCGFRPTEGMVRWKAIRKLVNAQGAHGSANRRESRGQREERLVKS